MTEWFQNFRDLVLTERYWSWSVIGIVYICVTMVIRGWVIRPVIAPAKELKHRLYHDMKDYYLKKAAPGWFFYFASLIIVILVWIRPDFNPGHFLYKMAFLSAFACYGLSLLMHLQALAMAAVAALRRLEQK